MSIRSESVASAPAVNATTVHNAGVLSASNPQCLQTLFQYQAPLVIFFVRHPDKEGTGIISTPPEINEIVKQIENHFTPLIEANKLLETSSTRTFIALEFGKAIDIYPASNVAVLHIYIVAIDHKDIKPKKIASIAKDWREEISKNGDENHAIVLLYHPALLEAVDLEAILAQAAKQSFFPKKFAAVTSAAASAKLSMEEAAILAHEYMEEIKKTRVGKAVFVYHPSDVMTKISDALKLAYANRAVRLKVLRHQVQTARNSPGWSIQEFWRKGYDVAIHHLRFGCLQEAMASFMQLFTEFYNKSDDFGFIKQQDWDVLVRLGSLKNMFDPQRIVVAPHSSPSNQRGSSRSSRQAAAGNGGSFIAGYPPMLADSADIVDALVFIVGCEMYCAVLLDNKAGALARFDCFMEVAREKLSEEIQKETNPEAKRSAIAITEFFFYRAYMSALDLCCNFAASLSTPVGRTARSQSTVPVEEKIPNQQLNLSAAECSTATNHNTSIAAETPEARSETRSAHSIGAGSECVTTVCETLLGVEGVLRYCDEELLSSNAPLQKELEAFQVSLGELCLAARDHFVTLGGACGVSLKALASATALAAKGRQGGQQQMTDDPPVHPAVAASATSLMVKSLPMIDELKTPEAFEGNYVALTRIAASAFRSGKRHRHECVMLLELAQLLLKSHPARAAEIIRTQILPQLSASQWGYLHAYARKLYVECFETITRSSGGAIPSGVGETYEGCLECVFQLLHGLTDVHERHYYWQKLLALELVLRKIDLDDSIDPFPLTALLRSKPRLCLRKTPASANADAHSPNFKDNAKAAGLSNDRYRSVPLGTNGDFVVLSSHVDEAVHLRMTASCPVDILTETSEQQATTAASSDALTSIVPHRRHVRIEATLESKKNWLSADEPTHLVTIDKFSIVSYNDSDQTLDISMPLVPCHAGEYRLRTLSLHIGCIHLKTSWIDQPVPFVLFVPEPDIGIEFLVDPLNEFHCFADSEDFCTASVVIKKPLDVDDPDEDCDKSAAGHGQVCAFEGADSPVMDMLSASSALALREASQMGKTQSAISMVYNKLSQQDERDGAIVGRVLVGKPTAASAGSGPSASAARRAPSSTTVTPKRSGAEGGFAPSYFGELPSDVDPLGNGSFAAEGGAATALMVSNDSLTGATAQAEFRRSVSARRPRGLSNMFEEQHHAKSGSHLPQRFPADKLYEFEDKGNGKGEKTTVPSSFERKLLSVPSAASDHEVSLGVDASVLHNGVFSFSLRLADESVATKEALLRATTLRLKIPLMPSFMLPEKTHFSFCCKRDRDVVVQDARAAIKFRHAFSCTYAFKAFQGRVNCLVTLENVLPNSPLLIHSLRLELVDSDAAYIITRTSKSNRAALKRPFTPSERLALFYELTPSPTFHSTRGVATHRVQLVVCYSKWTERVVSPVRATSSEFPPASSSPHLHGASAAPETDVIRSIQASPTARSPVAQQGRDPLGMLRNIPVIASGANSRSTTPDNTGGCVTPQHHPAAAVGNSILSMSSMAKKVPVPEVLMHTEAEWRDLAQVHNVYHAPIGAFESRHHCLFNVMVLLADNSMPSTDDTTDVEPYLDLASHIMPSCVFPPVASTVKKTWGLEGRIFPIGEPVYFDVILEPQASNWPDVEDKPAVDHLEVTAHPTHAESTLMMHHSSEQDQFFVKIVVDPAQWMVLGRSVELRTLSRWEDHRCRFAAVPIAPSAASIINQPAAKVTGAADTAGHEANLALVDTPTVVVYRATFTTSTVTPGELVPVDVVLCRASLHLRTR